MGKGFSGGALAVVMLSGISLHWTRFESSQYPYTISRPSSFRHQVVVTTGGAQVDYFFPVLLGSFPTNVNIEAKRGGVADDAVQYLRSIDGHSIHRTGWLTVMGHRLALEYAGFHGLVSRWTEEQVSFVANGYAWRITASYEPRFKKWRAVMLRMIESFQTR